MSDTCAAHIMTVCACLDVSCGRLAGLAGLVVWLAGWLAGWLGWAGLGWAGAGWAGLARLAGLAGLARLAGWAGLAIGWMAGLGWAG